MPENADHDEGATPAPATWEGRVEFPGSGPAAAKPGAVILYGTASEAQAALARLSGPAEISEAGTAAPDDVRHREITGGFDTLSALQNLRAAGFSVQPNHVLFADCWACGNPGVLHASSLIGNPFSGNPFSGNPFSGNPFSGNPFSGNPFSGNPFSGNPFSGNPFSGNPFSGNLFLGNPFAAVYGNPRLAGQLNQDFALTGRGRSLATPAPEPGKGARRPGQDGPVVAVLDVPLLSEEVTLIAGGDDTAVTPWLLQGLQPTGPLASRTTPGDPTGRKFAAGVADQDGDGWLDRVAGHGMFVSGVIAQVAPDCQLLLRQAMTNIGDVVESTVIGLLDELAGQVDVVNLSFGGYAIDDMPGLAEAVRTVQMTPGPWQPKGTRQTPIPASKQGAVVVVSAGNDGSCFPSYPACLPGVVSVGALGPDGPAGFSNWGPWVRACAAGVDVVSTFFRNYKRTADTDPDTSRFDGGASWSGTSFAAPLVAGRLAQLMAEDDLLPKEAVHRLIDAPGKARLPWMGTIVT